MKKLSFLPILIAAIFFNMLQINASSVVEIIVNSEDHTVLETAVIAAELNDDLSGDGPFTVFAPTDNAFSALPEGTLDALLSDPTGELAQILLYHVSGSSILSTDLSDGQMAVTLQGDNIEVTLEEGNVYINGAQVTIADILADNGVVHVIDAVLLPSQPTSIQNKNMDLHVKLYPNPAQNVVNIDLLNTILVDQNVKILDISGKVVLSSVLGNSSSSLNIENLRSGIYFMVINTASERIVEKLIVQ